MNREKIINAAESAIMKVTKDIRKKEGAVGVDKLNAFSRLLNSYRRLLDTTITDPPSDSDPDTYYDKMERECLSQTSPPKS